METIQLMAVQHPSRRPMPSHSLLSPITYSRARTHTRAHITWHLSTKSTGATAAHGRSGEMAGMQHRMAINRKYTFAMPEAREGWRGGGRGVGQGVADGLGACGM